MTIALHARALAFGVTIAILLCSLYFVLDLWLAQYHAAPGLTVTRMFPLSMMVSVVAVDAIVIATLCTPIWLALKKLRLDGWTSAAILGFSSTMTFWVITNFAPGRTMAELIGGGIYWAVFGALSGLATRWNQPRDNQPRTAVYAGNAAAVLVVLYVLDMIVCAIAYGDSIILDNFKLMSHGVKNLL